MLYGALYKPYAALRAKHSNWHHDSQTLSRIYSIFLTPNDITAIPGYFNLSKKHILLAGFKV